MKLPPTSRSKSRQGFSIAELMVVILIIGLLATQVMPKVLGSFGKAKRGKAISDISTIDKALEQYAINNSSRFPDSLQPLVDEDEFGNSFLKQTAIPKDPWGNEYHYEAPRGGQKLVLMSYGADGQPGGEGDDRDITIADILDGTAK